MQGNIFVGIVVIPVFILLFGGGTIECGYVASFWYPHMNVNDHVDQLDAIIQKYAEKWALAGEKEVFTYKLHGQRVNRLMFDHAKNVVEVALFYRRLLTDNYPQEEGRAKRSLPPIIEPPNPADQQQQQHVPPVVEEHVPPSPPVHAPPPEVMEEVAAVPRPPSPPQPVRQQIPPPTAQHTPMMVGVSNEAAASIKESREMDNKKEKEPTVDNAKKEIKKMRWYIVDKALRGTVTLDEIVKHQMDSQNPIAMDAFRKTVEKVASIREQAVRKFVAYVHNALLNYAKASNADLLSDEQIQAYMPVLQQFKQS